MSKFTTLLAAALAALVCIPGAARAAAADPVPAADRPELRRVRIAVVSSYHREYLWSQDTNRGVVAALLHFGYLDSDAQGAEYTRSDRIESSRAVVRKLWMDTKRHNTRDEIKESVARIVHELDAFRPDIILLGDDNATNYIGNQYIDSRIPVVFWGVNGNPLKYGLVDSIDAPGHNVTGVYQAGYLKEGIIWLRTLLPGIRRIAVLSDDSETGRSKAKELLRLERRAEIPVRIVKTVITNSYEQWKSEALALADRVDAFFVVNHNTLRDAGGRIVDQLEAGAWYLRNIHKPDIGHERQFVEEGILCAVDDSGYKQGYEAVRIANQILARGREPADIAVYAPERGPFVINLERARMLGLDGIVRGSPLVEEAIPEAMALHSGY